MPETSGLNYSQIFVDPKTGRLARWGYHYLLNPSVTTLNIAPGGSLNAPSVAVTAQSIQLGVPLRPPSGGLGISSGTSGGVPGFTSPTTIASSPTLGAAQIVLGGGAGATPSTPVGLGTVTSVLHGNALGAPTWSAVDLAADVTGTVLVVNGGTGAGTAPGARTNLGLGTISTQDANNIAVTGGTLDGTTVGSITAAAGTFAALTATGVVTGSSIGTASFQATGALDGGTVVNFYRSAGTVGATVTNTARGYTSAPTTDASAFTLSNYNHYEAFGLTIGAGSAVTTQSGFRASAGLTTATNNYGFRGLIATAANRWNCYMDGTAPNYFKGTVQTDGAMADTSYSYQTPSTGFTITIGDAVQTLILDPSGALLAGTITMPANPVDGHLVRITSTQNITTLTVSPNSGQSIKNAPTGFTVSLTGDQGYEFIYRVTNTTWYRLQ
jgi:hypothetical protein